MVIAVDALRVAYMAVPKAGCSTVKGMLAELDPDVKPPAGDDFSNPGLHGRYQTRRFRGDHFGRYDGFFRFTVLRDPVQRLLSVYTDRVAKRGDLRLSKTLLRGQADLPMDPDPDHFFQHLRGYMAASSIIKHHALPVWFFTGPDLGVYDRVYRIEDMEALAADLAVRAGRAPALRRRNASGGGLALDDLAPRTRRMIRKWIAPQYDYLGGRYAAPF